MTMVYVAAGARGATASATTLTPALPSITGRSLGVLLAVVSVKSNASITTGTSGWTKLYQDNSGASFTTAYFVAPVGSSAASCSWAGAVAAGAQCFYIEDPDNPMVTNAAGATSVASGTSNPHTSASINTTRQFSLVVYIDTAASNDSLFAPAGWTENNNEGSATDAGRTVIGSKYVATSGGASGAISVTGSASAWVQRQIELLIVTPATGIQVTEAEIAPGIYSGDGISTIEVEASPTIHSGVGISVCDMEIVALLGPGEPTKRRTYAQVFQ
jgi:hypothetical protein